VGGNIEMGGKILFIVEFLGRKEEAAKHVEIARKLAEEWKKTSSFELYLLNPH
jgi:hypothetical protein